MCDSHASQTKYAIEVMQAYMEGKKIEYRGAGTSSCWRDIVNTPLWDWSCFDYRVKPEPPPTPMNIPWEHIKPEWKYAARDKDGAVFLYGNKPRILEHFWVHDSSTPNVHNYKYVSGIMDIDVGTVDWKDSLQERP